MRTRYFLSNALVIGYLNHDPESVKTLITRVLENCRQYLEGYISEGYKDVAQQVLIAIWNHRDNPKMQDHPGAYATTVNKGKIKDALDKVTGSKEILESEESLIDNQVSSDPTPLHKMIEKEWVRDQRKQLKGVLDTILMSDDSILSDALKNGRIALIYQMRDSASVIAEVMGVPEENVKNWVSRFTQKYQEMEQVPKGTIKSWVSRYREYLRRELDR